MDVMLVNTTLQLQHKDELLQSKQHGINSTTKDNNYDCQISLTKTPPRYAIILIKHYHV